MKKYIAFILFSFMICAKSQTTSHWLINLGYSNLNGNYGKIGPELYLVRPNGNLIDLSLTANMAHMKSKFFVIPELGVGYQFNAKKTKNRIDPYREYINSTFYSIRVNASPWNVTPEIGISLLGLFEFNAGYSFETKKHDYTSLDGLKLGLSIRVPLIVIFGEKGFH